MKDLLNEILQVSKDLEKFKSKGITEIKIIRTGTIKDGYPILLVSENDYELFKQDLKVT